MMFHFPFFNMPYYNRYSRYGYRYPYYGYSRSNPASTTKATTYSNSNTNESFSKYGSFNKNLKQDVYKSSNSKDATNIDNNHNESYSNVDSDSPLFQLFGINLYFDDILLICLIWFLYDEGVKDEGLFMALILLLLS